jgi:hypothetical protein
VSEEYPEASQEKPCWLCALEGADHRRCLYHVVKDIPGRIHTLLVENEAAKQNRAEWEERALKAEAELETRTPSPAHRDAPCPECNGGYPEVCPVCQLDGHPVAEKLRAKVNALLDLLRRAEEALEACAACIDSAGVSKEDWPKRHARTLAAEIKAEVSKGAL